MKFCSAPTWRIGGIHWTDCFFVFVIYFTLRLGKLLISLETLTELNEIHGALGNGVEPLDDELFLPLLQKEEIHQLEDPVFW